jgi:hypothetical protein
MPGKKPSLTPLAARKQLLLMESEMNRVRLIEAVHGWKTEVHRTKQHIMNFGSVAAKTAKAAAAVSAVAGLFANRGRQGKPSWISLALKAAATGTSVWYWLRSRKNEHQDEA